MMSTHTLDTGVPTAPLAVLVSGGLDSAVLVGLAARQHAQVVPIYVQAGLQWETVELAHLHRFLHDLADPQVQPLVTLAQPVQDLYGQHWSISGQAVPDALAPDEDFFLPGRNALLLLKALLWCHLNNVPGIALATLAANPFPDATPAFFAQFAAAVNSAVNGRVRVYCPLAGRTKAEVVQMGRAMPLVHTLSCARPLAGGHCGVCGKCAERGRSFVAAGVPDPTVYQSSAWVGTVQRPGSTVPDWSSR
jgi:7-cyano-7-deazaguanine synthase